MLQQLGINHTVFIQFAIYIFTFIALVFLVYSPFTKAYFERRNRTKGTEEVSFEYQRKATELHSEYQTKAREVNSKIQDIYQKLRGEAASEYDQMVNQAKQEAHKKLEENRRKIYEAVSVATKDLSAQTPQIALLITNKLLGKS